jgi:hypothetical protein
MESAPDAAWAIVLDVPLNPLNMAEPIPDTLENIAEPMPPVVLVDDDVAEFEFEVADPTVLF